MLVFMENVSRVVYKEGLNQLWLLRTKTLKTWLGEGRLVDGDILEIVSRYVGGIRFSGKDDVVLGGCFTNVSGNSRRDYGPNLMVFPLGEKSVSYDFRKGVSYVVERGGNPEIIFVDEGFGFCDKGSISFFGENPFESDKDYCGAKSFLFQSADDERVGCLVGSRKKIVRKTGKFGFGSLEAFA